MVELIRQATKLGYSSIRLDTIPQLDKAISLYKKYQFMPIEPYRHNPYLGAEYYELNLLERAHV